MPRDDQFMSLNDWMAQIQELYQVWRTNHLIKIQKLIAENISTLIASGDSISYYPPNDKLWEHYAGDIKTFLETQGFACELISAQDSDGVISPPSLFIKIGYDQRRQFEKFEKLIRASFKS